VDVIEASWEAATEGSPVDLDLRDVQPTEPSGAAAAALLAAGIGCALFGLLVLLNDAIPALKEALTFSKAVGPLSGKATVGVAAWLLVWAVLHVALRGRDVATATVVRVTRVLIALGLLLTFPPFYLLFAAH
jgi:hypothetical protein